jgi:hypothetical protein
MPYAFRNKKIIHHQPIIVSTSGAQLICWFRLHLQSLAHTNPHWARVVCYSPFLLCVIHKEGLCPSSGGIKKQVMMMIVLLSSMVVRQLSDG